MLCWRMGDEMDSGIDSQWFDVAFMWVTSTGGSEEK